MFSGKCSICFKVNDLLKEISQTDEDSLTLSSKLEFVVPEVDWINNYKVCEVCISEVRTSFRFKQQCLNLKDYVKEEQCESFAECDFKLDYDSDDSDVIQESKQYFMCYHCEYKTAAKEELLEHIQRSHQNYNKESLNNKRKTLCFRCGRKFAKETSIKEHLKICDGVRRHRKVNNELQCGNCKRFYSTEKNLRAHEKRCTETGLKKTDFQCLKCNVYYINEKALSNHTTRGCKKEGKEPAYFCKSCKNVYNTVLDLKNHNFKDHGIVEFKCEKCDKIFEDNEEYNSHKSEHKKLVSLRILSCEVCNMEFKSLKEIVEHSLNEHSLQKMSIKPYFCDLCHKRFRSSTNLQNHKLYHEGNRRHVCSICGKCFITKSDLYNHEVTHSGTRKFECNKCDKAFKTNSNLRTHYLMMHTDPMLWKFVCKICGKRFPLKSDHDLHVRRHNGQKEFICSLCKKPFTSNRELQVHIRSHSDVKQFICDECDKEYRTKNTLDIHRAKAHGLGNAKIPVREKKHVCHICPARFSDKVKLARHLCTHSGLKPFACFVCEKKFTDKSYMKQHLKIVHNVVDDPLLKGS